MLIYQLAKNEVTIKIYTMTGTDPQIIEIKDGIYKRNRYASLLLSENNVILEGDSINILATDTKTVIIQTKNILMQLTELLKNDRIYIDGIDAIPAGEERNILEALIKQD